MPNIGKVLVDVLVASFLHPDEHYKSTRQERKEALDFVQQAEIIDIPKCPVCGNYHFADYDCETAGALESTSTTIGLCPEHGKPINSTGLYYECLCPAGESGK